MRCHEVMLCTFDAGKGNFDCARAFHGPEQSNTSTKNDPRQCETLETIKIIENLL